MGASRLAIEKYEKVLKRCLTDSEILRLGEIEECYEKARIQFIVIHRVNNYAYDTCIRVFDEMEKRNIMRFTAKHLCKKLDTIWNNYIGTIRENTDRSTFMLLQDNFRIATDYVRPNIDTLITAIRDYYISKGVRDTVFVAEAEAAMLLLKICTHSYKNFFIDFKEVCGVDFSSGFMYANMEQFDSVFHELCKHLGLVTDIDIFDNCRCSSAWNDMMETIRNDELMDEAAGKAIHFNPSVEIKYKKELSEIEKKETESKLSELSEKFKVSKLK